MTLVRFLSDPVLLIIAAAAGVCCGQPLWLMIFPPSRRIALFTVSALLQAAGAVVFLLYTLILLRSLAVGLALKGGERLLALGLGLYLALQAALNIGVTLGVLPVTGVPLPLVSYGGSSLLVSGFAVGLLSRLAREAAERPRRKGVAR